MPNTALLNNIEHKDLRIITRRGAQYGDAQMAVATFPAEFRDAQACFPIIFRQTTDGLGYEPLVLLGFQDGENLFLKGEVWDAPYVPLMLERQPFLIGVNPNGELMVHVDVDHPRVSSVEGTPVFKEHGGTSDFLEYRNSMLAAIHQGMQGMPAFLAALLKYELLESFVLDVELNDGSQNRLAGFYTINEDKLAALDAAALGELHQAGHLQAIYMAVASLSNLRHLIDRKNALLHV